MPKEDCNLKMTIAGSDFVIHFMCIALSLWWVDDFHSCIPIEKNNQAMVWCVFVGLTFVLHVIQYQVSIARRQQLVNITYSHCVEEP